MRQFPSCGTHWCALLVWVNSPKMYAKLLFPSAAHFLLVQIFKGWGGGEKEFLYFLRAGITLDVEL